MNQASNKSSSLNRLLTLVTGAQDGEYAKTIYSFLALFFLLTSYYLIKPLRNSQFLKEFDPNLLPFFFLIIPILSFAVTKVFNYFYDRIDKYQLITYTYIIVIICKVSFTWLLPLGHRVIIVIFYFWATVYFLLAIAILWSCINYIFSSAQGERCYGFIAVGATIGSIIGSSISSYLAQSDFKNYVTLISALIMGLALASILQASKSKASNETIPVKTDPNSETVTKKELNDNSFFSDFKDMVGIKYVRAIAVMVFALAFFGTTMEFQSQKVISNRLAKEQYKDTFSSLDKALNQSNSSEKINQAGFLFIQSLKQFKLEEVQRKIVKFVKENPNASLTIEEYLAYKDQLEGRTRQLFSEIYKYQGVLGIFLLLVVSRFLFALGIRFAIMILPIFVLIAATLLFFPIDLLIIEVLLVVGGALNYSLNNATKELLYTQTSDETKFKHKPLIEGPVMRLGDVSASIIKLLLGFLLLTFVGFSDVQTDQAFLVIAMGVVIYWILSVWYAGGEYDKKRQKSSEI